LFVFAARVLILNSARNSKACYERSIRFVGRSFSS
jgi:hypothetical protein